MSVLNLELHNNSGEQTVDMDFQSYVTAHTEYINYNKYTDAASTMISFVGSDPQTPQKNLFIKDLSWKHPRNNINYIIEFEETKSNFIFKAPFKELYITNITNQTNQPLYFKHKTKFKKDTQVNLTIKKNGEFVEGESINNASWKVVNGFVYNNYENKFSFVTGSHELYYLSGEGADGNPVNELLSNIEAIGEFSWRDIDPDTGEMLVSGYSRNQVGSQYEFNIHLSGDEICETDLNKLYIRAKESNTIKILSPESLNLENSWTVRIQNGFFFKSKKYYISEYLNQNFNPEVGIIKLYNKQCHNVGLNETSHVIKLPTKGIEYNPETNMNVTVIIKDENDNIIRGITSDVTLIDSSIQNSDNKYTAGIKSVDEKSGFIELEESLLSSSKIFCNFHYKAESYFVTDLDLNPISNDKIITGRYYLYLKPNLAQGEKSVQWLYLDRNDIILNCSDEDLKVEIENAQGRIVFNPDTIIKTSLNSFKSTYCYGYQNTKEYLELGEISYRETEYLDEALIFDLFDKTPVSELNYKSMISRQWKILQSKFGYGDDGQVYQDNNIVYIQLQKNLLVDFGGEYTESELYDLLKSKLHVGTELIFDWDYFDLTIDLDNSVVGEIQVSMSWEGPGRYVLTRRVNNISGNNLTLFDKDISARPDNDIIIYSDNTISDTVNSVYYYYTYENQQSEIAGAQTRRS
jgi:hypothetical protein